MKIEENSKATILVMLSGGLDSTAMLYKMLSEAHGKEYLHVLFLELLGWESDIKPVAERMAVEKILMYLKKDFQFDHSMDFHSYGSFAFDQMFYYFSAALTAKSMKNVHSVAIGRTKEDVALFNQTTRHKNVIETAENIFYETVNGNSAMSFTKGEQEHREIKLIFPVEEFTKKELFNLLPLALKDSFCSCRRPDDMFQLCGKCSKCISIEKLKKEK